MYVRTWKKSNTFYASIVESNRINGKVIQKNVLYLGVVEENQIPYLKAAYAKKKPILLYEDGTLYEG